MNNILTSEDMQIIRKHVKNNKSLILHTPTREVDYAVLTLLDYLGLKWCNGKTLPDNTEFDDYEEDTCYFFEVDDISYGRKPYFEKEYKEITLVTFGGIRNE